MRVFVTGSTGLLGINTVNALLSKGYNVLVLVRNPEKARRVLPQRPELRLIHGDIERPDEWLPRLVEADALVHAAAYFREYFGRGDHDAKLRTLNVELPLLLTNEADRIGMNRVVMVSSSGVVEARPDGRPADESDAAGGALPDNAYFMSKVEMERELSALTPSLHRPPVIVRPGWMFGPNDYAPTAAGQLVLDLLRRGKIQLTSGMPLGIADARDVARGIVAILEHSAPSRIYNLAGNSLIAIDALREVARQAGNGKVQQIPLPVALFGSAALELLTRLINKPNPIPRMGIMTLSQGVSISSARAIKELGVQFRPFAETAKDSVHFFRNVYPRAAA